MAAVPSLCEVAGHASEEECARGLGSLPIFAPLGVLRALGHHLSHHFGVCEHQAADLRTAWCLRAPGHRLGACLH